MTDAYEYDPERALWKPGRRSFLFMFGAASAALLLPDVPRPLITSETITLAVATGYRGPLILSQRFGGLVAWKLVPIRAKEKATPMPAYVASENSDISIRRFEAWRDSEARKEAVFQDKSNWTMVEV